MVVYKGIEFDPTLAPLVRHMGAVEEYRETLQTLQAVWDNLTLLGQLSGTGTDMSDTRQAFAALTADLLNQLGLETRNKTVQELKSRAQVAVDILIRNLFERTADIGFLATDNEIRDFARRMREGSDPDGLPARREALRARFREYVRKYSVYRDIVLLDPAGRVLARLDGEAMLERSTDPLVAEALATDAAYVEVFRASDLQAGRTDCLIYAYRVVDADGSALAVLCLCFRFESELREIFAKLRAADDWCLLALLDAEGRVIASSDGHQLPLGAHLPSDCGCDWRVMRFGGREYLAVTRPTQGYQGYAGPGWLGHAMVPLEHAFEQASAEALAGVPAPVLQAVMNSPSLFAGSLREIPRRAECIQRELDRSVWNGNVRQRGERKALNPAFSKVLLWEISHTGMRTRDVFERSIGNLHETVVSAILDEGRFLAGLAIDIMDRNLYERANDCRWWALTGVFRDCLAAPDEAGRQRMSAVLEGINRLYTVYDNLVVFDAAGQLLAVSNPREAHRVGRVLGDEWVRRCLALKDSQRYVVSDFAPSALYGGGPTYVYAAAIHGDDGRVLGGIGIAFDATPQLAAMLGDALPRGAGGDTPADCLAVFADRQRRVLACSSPRFAIGQALPLGDGFFSLARGAGYADIVELDGEYHAVGAAMSSGYREYKGEGDEYVNDVLALIFVPLGPVAAAEAQIPSHRLPAPRRRMSAGDGDAGDSVEIATFHIGDEWFGFPSAQVVEAIEARGITPVPGMPEYVAGVVMFQRRPILVLDLRNQLRFARPVEPADYAQIVVLHGQGDEAFGILAHRLGEIPEVPVARIEPMSALFQGESVLADSVVSPDPGEARHGILVVLSVERIRQKLVRGRAEAIAQPAAPLRVRQGGGVPGLSSVA